VNAISCQSTGLNIKSIRIDAWTDGKERDGSPYERFALHIERDDAAAGLRRVWFILSARELRALIVGEQSEFADGYHRMSVCGDEVTFYDLDFPRDDAGAMTLKYMRLQIPRPFWRYCARIARFVWRAQYAAIAAGADDYNRPSRIELSIGLETLERFQRRYGTGRGEFDTVTYDTEVTDGKWGALGDGPFCGLLCGYRYGVRRARCRRVVASRDG
jgi:hypothetical protein